MYNRVMQDGEFWGETMEREPPAVKLAAFACAEAAKTLLPSVISTNWQEMFKHAPGYGLAFSMSALSELAGWAGVLSGRPEMGSAIVGGKLSSWIFEARARTYLDYRDPIGLEAETPFVKGPAYLGAIAAKIVLPGMLSAGEMEHNAGRTGVWLGTAVELVGGGAMAMGRPDVGLPLYAGGRLISLFSEEADRRFPGVAASMKRLSRQIRTDVSSVGRKAGEMVSSITHRRGGGTNG